MRTELEQVALLSKFQCQFVDLANLVATKLSKYKMCDIKDNIRDMTLARAYIYRIHKYYALPYNVLSAVLIDIVRNNTTSVTITITIDGTAYTYTGTGDLVTVMNSLKGTLIGGGFNIHSVDDDSFIVYTYDKAFDSVTTTCVNSLDDDDNSTTCTEYTTTSADVILEDKNCLTREEICGIINHTCCILDKYATTC